MDNQMRLGAVLIGGYLLGRTKKGGMALRLATRMMMSGSNTDPRELVQDNAMKLLNSEIVEQLRAQMMEAAKAAVDARVQGLAQNLTDRTEALKNPAIDAVGGVTSTLTKDDSEEDQDDEQGEQEDQQAEGEGEEPEGEAEGSEEDQREGEDAPAEDEDDGDDADKDEAIRARTTELKRKRIATLRNLANEMFEGEEDEIEEASKDDLARWIAEAEAEDEEEDD